jgi:head-tail adaptor
MLRKGQLRHRLQIQVKDPRKGQNTFGEESMIWLDDVKVWGAIYPMRGTEYHFSREQTAVTTHKVRLQYFNLADGRRPVPGNFRIKYHDHKTGDDRFFDPQVPLTKEERKWYMDYMCVESD